MMIHRFVFSGVLTVIAVGGSWAQQTPRTRTTVVPATEPATITVSLRGAEAQPFVTVKAANSDVRRTLTEMAEKSGVRVLLAPSVTGVINGSVTNEAVDAAFSAVATMAGLTARKIVLPEASVAALTAETAGRYVEALSALPVGAMVADAAGGKALSVTATPPAPAAGMTTVFYVQGRLSPEQERIARERRTAQANAAQAGAAVPNSEFVTKTAQSLQAMPLQQRFETMRSLQRQMFESMSEAERAQMRESMPRGGRGGFRQEGGPGGRNNN